MKKTMSFVFLFIFIGLSWHIQDLSIPLLENVHSKFEDGNLTINWTQFGNLSKQKARLKKGQKDWSEINGTEHTVEDILLYDTIYIDIYVLGDPNYRRLVYKVIQSKRKKGETFNITWETTSIPASGNFHVYHKNVKNENIEQSNWTTVDIRMKHEESDISSYDSNIVMLEIRNVTPEDAGYYNGGWSTSAVMSGGGAILIVLAKPSKPKLLGNFSIPVKKQAELTCFSKSNSVPDYYARIAKLSYIWFLNETKRANANGETLKLYVTRADKYNRYSCMVTEEDLESNKSDPVQINPLYGPEIISIIPQPSLRNNHLVMKEGDMFGPYTCSVSCNPPCNIVWTYNTTSSSVNTHEGKLPQQPVNRTFKSFHCEARWESNPPKEEVIQLNVQYLDKPRFFFNGNQRSSIDEHTSFQLCCFVDGNPTPEITMIKGSDTIGKKEISNWFNHSVNSASCADTDTYSCIGANDGFNVTKQIIDINVMCKPRIAESEASFQTIFASTSGENVHKVILIPVIANPAPRASDITWIGPIRESIQSVVSQRDAIYEHLINTTVGVYNHSYFGKYILKHKNETLVTITINAQDKPQTPLNFTGYSDAVGNVNLTWVSGFNGGMDQVFIVSIKNDLEWKNVANLTDPGEGKVVFFETKHFTPGQKVWYRLESCNKINCSIQLAEIKIHVKDFSTGQFLGLNKVTFAAIGSSATLFILSVIFVVVLVKCFQRKTKRNYNNMETEKDITQGAEMYAVGSDKSDPTKNRSKDEAEANGESGDNNECYRKSAGEMYAAVDKSPLKGNKINAAVLDNDKTNEKEDNIQHGAEMYAVVDKSLLKKGGKSKPRTNMVTAKKSKEKNKGKKELLEENNELSTGSRRTNDEGLIYIDVDFMNKTGSSDTTQKPVIHGEEDRTEYTFVDFSKKAPPTPETHDKELK